MPALDYTLRFIEPEESPSAWYEPVTLAEVKANSRIDLDDDDALIEGLLIPAARKSIEKKIDKLIGLQTWEMALIGWPCSQIIEIPKVPLQSIIWVKYTDKDGAETAMLDTEASPPVTSSVLAVSLYSEPGFLFLKPSQYFPTAQLYTGYPIAIRFQAGIPLDKVREQTKQAILMMVGHLYEHREAVSSEGLAEVPMGISFLLEGEAYVTYP